MKKDVIIACLVVILILMCWSDHCQTQKDFNSQPNNDTITWTYYDTIPVFVPTPKDSIIKKYKRVYDTLTHRDTVYDTIYTYVPIYQYHFQDSLYNIYISGFDVTLDSLFIYPVQNIVQVSQPPSITPSRFSVGLQGGVTLIAGKPQVYLGVGVTYNLFYFNKNKPKKFLSSIL